MNNQDYLNFIIERFSTLAAAMPTQLLLIKNTHSEHIYHSPAYLRLIAVEKDQTNSKRAIKRANIDDTELIYKKTLEEDVEIITSRQSKSLLLIIQFKDGAKPQLYIKSPLINPHNNEVIGIVGMIYEYCWTSLAHKAVSQYSSTSTSGTMNKIKLTKRERQIIFFFMRRLNSQEIAEMIGRFENQALTKNTIDSIIANSIFKKFEVNNRQQLYDKLLKDGYDKLIPTELLTGFMQHSIQLANVNIY